MSEITQPENRPADNPFVSPGEPDREAWRSGNEPSWLMLSVCVAVAMVAAFSTSFWLYFDADSSTTRKLLAVIPDALFGAATGLGLALLVHALLHKRFDTLAPGHWRLIVSLGLYLGYAGAFLPDLFSALFYVVFLWRTSETKVWQGYAWSSLVGFVLTSILAGMAVMMLGDVTQMIEAMTEPGGKMPGNPLMLVALMGMGFLQSIVDALTLGLLIAGVITDQQNGVKRDIYHYIGVALMLFLPLVLWGGQLGISQVS